MLGLIPLALATLAAPAAAPTQDLAFSPDLAAAFEQSRSESKRLVLGVYSAGEARSEDFVKRVFKDKAVRRALADAVAVQALLGTPSKVEARRFGGHDQDIHRMLERSVRDHLPANAEGVLASPQHVWFGPEGRLLLAAPFELEPEEFLWLDWRARQLSGDAAAVAPVGARAPRRFLEGAAFAPADGDRFGRGLKPDEVKADLELLRRRGQGGGGGRGGGGGGGGNWTPEAIAAFARLAFSNDADAQDEVRNELGNVFLRWGGGSNALVEGALEIVAFAAPRLGVPTVVQFLNDTEAVLRGRSAAALEAMGFDGDGWNDLRKALDKEEDAPVRRAMLRAAGVVGRREAQARRTLEREAEKAKSTLDRAAALIGLGHIGDGAACEETLRKALGEADANVALAAACAMALTRDSARFRASIVERATDAGEDAALYEAALAVLDGGALLRLQSLLARVAADEYPRTRFFFTARPQAPPAGRGQGGRGNGGGNGGGGNGGGAGGGGER